MTDEAQELKPCPHCASEILEMDRVHKKYDRAGTSEAWWFISCYECPNQGVLAKTKELAIQAWNQRNDGEYQKKYNELIMQVGNKHPGESRHETALRYIKQAEESSDQCAQSQPPQDK